MIVVDDIVEQLVAGSVGIGDIDGPTAVVGDDNGVVEHPVVLRTAPPINLVNGDTTGVIVGMVTPTPGGLGGVEAGLVGAIVAYGNSSSLAFSAVIIYRLVTFWLPIIPGYLCFWLLRRRKVI